MIRWRTTVLGAAALTCATPGDPGDYLSPIARAAEEVPAACDAEAGQADLDYTLRDLDNEKVKLSDFRGRVLVLDFWATWCTVCKTQIPSFVDLQSRYGADGLQLVGISVDDTLDLLEPYVAEYKMNYPVLQGRIHDDLDDLLDAYGPVGILPTAVVIGRDGKICRIHEGAEAKEVFEREILALL